MQLHDGNNKHDKHENAPQLNTNAELASLSSDHTHLPQNSGKHRQKFTAIVALAMAAIMGTLGITGAVTSANARELSAAQVRLAQATFGMPTEMRVRALGSTKGESIRQTRLNRKAEAKHEVRQTRIKIVKAARAQIGDHYRAGHSGPNAFDCSGLVRYVYKKVTGKTLPHYSKAQYKQVRKIKKSEAQPGDLVFFFRNGAHHVGIYIGNNKMIDAPRTGKKVRVSPITGSWWSRSYTGMGRILPA